jgi:hypothetical protein
VGYLAECFAIAIQSARLQSCACSLIDTVHLFFAKYCRNTLLDAVYALDKVPVDKLCNNIYTIL